MLVSPIVAAALLLAGCEYDPTYDPNAPPPRPDGLPADAEWRGGPDGGNWVRCERAEGGLACEWYWQMGGLYADAHYAICVTGSVTGIHGYEFGHARSLEVAADGLTLVPTRPARIYRDGVVHPGLSAKAARDWREADLPDCALRLDITETDER